MKNKSKRYKNQLRISVAIIILGFNIITNANYSRGLKQQATSDYTIGFKIDDNFEFMCTKMDITALNDVFDSNWGEDVGDYMWWIGNVIPSEVGEKSKFSIKNITETELGFWQIIIKGWDWIPKDSKFDVSSDHEDAYNLAYNPNLAYFIPEIWLLPSPVENYIASMNLVGAFSYAENTILYSSSEITNYQIGWQFNADNGVVEKFWIKNEIGKIIFEIILTFYLKFQENESYQWVITTFDAHALEVAFEPSWEDRLRYYLWWTTAIPTTVGERSMLRLDMINNHSIYKDGYEIEIDGWNWRELGNPYGAVPNATRFTYTINMDPDDFTFGDDTIMVPTPVDRYLSSIKYNTNYEQISSNEVQLLRGYSQVMSFIWDFDENLGIMSRFRIKNFSSILIFDMKLMKINIPIDKQFEWKVNTLDQDRLEDVLGPNWAIDIQNTFGVGCNNLGASLKRQIGKIDLNGSFWEFEYKEWYWSSSSFPLLPDMSSKYLLNANSENSSWGSWMWLIPSPSEYYLSGLNYSSNSLVNSQTITSNYTDVENYQIKYYYDTNLGTYRTVQLVDEQNLVLFEFRLVQAQNQAIIPGYDLTLTIGVVFLITGLLSIAFYKKKSKSL